MVSVRTHSSPLQLLSHGAFFGLPMAQQSARGFTFAHHRSNGAQIAEHEHANAHFILITSGYYLTRASGNPRRDGPLFLYNPPGTVHSDCFAGGSGTFFAISDAANIPDGLAAPSGPIFVTNHAAYSIARRLLRELAGWRSDSPLVCEGLGLELHGLVGEPQCSPHRRRPRWVKEAWDVMRDRCTEPITIADVARLVGIHPVHLARAFREFYHASPGELLRDWRVRTAAKLLRETRHPVCDIALMSGFADQSHLSRVFKGHFGTTPVRFRGS